MQTETDRGAEGVRDALRIRVVLADDHPIFRKGLVGVVEADPRCYLVGEAADGAAAWELIQRLRPQIALLDIDIPVVDGLELTRRLRDAKLEAIWYGTRARPADGSDRAPNGTYRPCWHAE